MRKIEYPKDPTNPNVKLQFEKRYCRIISKKNERKINNELKNAPLFLGKILTFKTLISSDFDSLLEISKTLDSFIRLKDVLTKVKGKTVKSNAFEDLFDYKKQQPRISSFFMKEKKMNLKLCYYCGIDYINSFTQIADYSNKIDFIKRADFYDLQIVKGIGPSKALKIIEKRKIKKITAITDISNDVKIIKQINKFDFEHDHNHFTLDHVLPQKNYKFLSLCLYNFVPSCYSCNSKFKKIKDFDITINQLLKINPTSENYSLINDFQFKVLFSGNLKDISSVSDFTLFRKIKRNKKQIEDYFSIFKIDGRYKMHKDLILNLIENKIRYPTSIIEEISNTLGISKIEVKKIVFGKEYFDVDYIEKPLHKLRTDIAKDIKIIK